jgi:lambda family phage portal protein
MRARAIATVLSTYRGATKDRMHADWIPRAGSADADLLPDLPTLRQRSRALNRDDAHASAITNTVVSNIVGSGITPQCRIDHKTLEISPQQAADFARQAERAWKRWVPYADAQNRMDFYAIQGLIQRQILENGEVIALPLMVRDEPWRPLRLAYEIIEADRLETPIGKRTDPNIRDGVELGERGQPIAYWIRKRHPGDASLIGQAAVAAKAEFIRYPARNAAGRKNVLHLFWTKRPGQTRGEPFFAPVLEYFRNLGQTVEAELMAQRIAACFTAFVSRKTPYGPTMGKAVTNAKGQRIEEIEPGLVMYGEPGEEMSFGQPQRPGNTFEPFVMMILRAIGAALGLPFELVMKDFSRTNYSSARAALLEARRFFLCYQRWLAVHFCQPTWEMVLEEAWLSEQIPAVNLITAEQRDDWMNATWIQPGWGWIDPVDEVRASKDAIDAKLSTQADECAAQGRDWEEVMQQLAREKARADELGLVPDPEPDPAADPGEDRERRRERRGQPVGATA